MAEKKRTAKTEKTEKKPIVNNVIEQNITTTLETNYMPYAMSVIVSRAIPEIDGFKPSHRKLLYTMYKMGLLTGNRIKSADVVGQTMRLNPHGDGPIYETMVRLTRGHDALLHAFVDSKGNFGKQYSRDMAYAASRYTEVKLDIICNELFRDIDKNTVDFVESYNGMTKEPLLFPTTFPNLLVTPNQGIAVGMASSICSFNLKEVCNAAIQFIKNPNVVLTKYLLAPDFSTGAELIYNEREIETIYETGRGSFKMRAKYRYDKKNSCIEVYEIPYSTTIEVIIDKIVALVKAGKIRDVTDVRDETDLNGLKIAIDIKKSANPEHLMHKLYAMTSLSDSFSCNFNLLVDGNPRTMGIREILSEWLRFRMGCIKRQIAFEIAKIDEKIHLLEGLSKILLDIDKAIRIIRNTEEDSQVIPNLMAGFGIDKVQAEFIAEIKLRNLNKEYLLNRINELNGLRDELADLRDTLTSDEKIRAIISRQLSEVAKKYGKPRRTEIITEQQVVDIPDEVFIEDYGLKLYLTAHSYFKKIPLVSLRTSPEQNLKDDDEIIQEIEATNKSDVIFFSSKYNAYKAKVHELPDCKAASLGEYLTNLLGMEEDEQIVGMTATLDYSGYMLFAFENGKIAKINMSSYATKMNRKKLINAYSDKSRLIYIAYIAADTDFMAVRDADKAALFNTELIASKAAKNSSGVQVYSLLKRNSRMTKLMSAEQFITDEPEYYRTDKIPATGHFLKDKDREVNQLAGQMKLM